MVLAFGVVLAAEKAGVSRVVSIRFLLSLFSVELLCVLVLQSLPAAELHGFRTGEAAEGSSAEQVIQNVERNVPARGAPRDKAAIDVVPQPEARAAVRGFQVPPDIVVLK